MTAVAVISTDELRAIVREEIERALRAVQPDAMTAEQAAAYARRAPKTIRSWVASGRLAASHRGRRLAIRREDLDRALAAEEPTAAAATDEAWRKLRVAR